MHLLERRRSTARSSVKQVFGTHALRAADYVSLRDDKSRALVRRIGFTGESQVSPDNAYGLEVATEDGSPARRANHSGICADALSYVRAEKQAATEELI